MFSAMDRRSIIAVCLGILSGSNGWHRRAAAERQRLPLKHFIGFATELERRFANRFPGELFLSPPRTALWPVVGPFLANGCGFVNGAKKFRTARITTVHSGDHSLNRPRLANACHCRIFVGSPAKAKVARIAASKVVALNTNIRDSAQMS
jgi:hypothetical protein